MVARMQPLVVAPHTTTVSTPQRGQKAGETGAEERRGVLLQHHVVFVGNSQSCIDIQGRSADLKGFEARHLLQASHRVVLSLGIAHGGVDDRNVHRTGR